jgi:hypothetical protein
MIYDCVRLHVIVNACWIPGVAAAEETDIPSEGYHYRTFRLFL